MTSLILLFLKLFTVIVVWVYTLIFIAGHVQNIKTKLYSPSHPQQLDTYPR